MECKDWRIDGVPNTISGLTSKDHLTKLFIEKVKESIAPYEMSKEEYDAYPKQENKEK